MIAAFFGFMGKRLITKIDATAADLAEHKLEDVNKYAPTEAITLVHKRIDDSVKTAEENFRELRNGIGEIKTILINGGHR